MAWQLLVPAGLALAAYLARDKTVERVKATLEDWEPEYYYDNETGFRDDLADYLDEKAGDVYVVTEHGKGRGRRDIWIRSRENENVVVVVELKLRLSASAQVNHLLGQVLRYKSDTKALFIVLIDPDRNQLAELEQVVEKNFEEDKVEVVLMEFEDE